MNPNIGQDPPAGAEPRPALQVAVLMRRVPVTGVAARWQSWRWMLEDVVPQQASFGTEPRRLVADESGERWLHPGFAVELFRDDAEGYELNITTPSPGWFVLWRMEEAPGLATEPIARPIMVTLSYHDAGRWLDAQETVEQVPAPADVVEWLRAFVDRHRVAEPKQRRRPQSFRPLQDRFGRPATVTTDKKFGGGHG